LQKAVETAESARSPFAVADYLRRLSLILADNDYAAHFLKCISEEDLTKIMVTMPVSNSWLEALINEHFLPTPAILSFVLERQGTAKSCLEQRILEITKGGFNPSSPLDIEIEYSRHIFGPRAIRPDESLELRTQYAALGVSREYLRSAYGHDIAFKFSDFAGLPFRKGTEPIFYGKELVAADATAKEAVAVFNLIKAKMRNGVQMMVIGNRRYGQCFVVNIIEKYLIELGAKVVYETISSFKHDRINPEFLDNYELSEETFQWVTDNSPDIAVVDGTKNIGGRHGNTRFPAAMGGYMAAFSPNKFRINFWAPNLTPEISLGNADSYKPQVSGTATRELYIISAAGPKDEGGSGAYFDDPEMNLVEENFFFSKTGFTRGRIWGSVEDYASSMQELVTNRVTELIRQPAG
jgi:hypothetical protein